MRIYTSAAPDVAFSTTAGGNGVDPFPYGDVTVAWTSNSATAQIAEYFPQNLPATYPYLRIRLLTPQGYIASTKEIFDYSELTTYDPMSGFAQYKFTGLPASTSYIMRVDAFSDDEVGQ